MQLIAQPRTPRLGRIAAGLSLLSANLLAANSAMAESDEQPKDAVVVPGLMTEPAPGPASLVIDSSVLFYKEEGSRVQAVEPVIAIQDNLANGNTISGSLTFDSLTGATPNGATPYSTAQTFTSVIHATTTTSRQVTSTSASGGATVTTISPAAERGRTDAAEAARRAEALSGEKKNRERTEAALAQAQAEAEQARRKAVLDLADELDRAIGHVAGAVSATAEELQASARGMARMAELTAERSGQATAASRTASRRRAFSSRIASSARSRPICSTSRPT